MFIDSKIANKIVMTENRKTKVLTQNHENRILHKWNIQQWWNGKSIVQQSKLFF